jgi:hypothetical protein
VHSRAPKCPGRNPTLVVRSERRAAFSLVEHGVERPGDGLVFGLERRVRPRATSNSGLALPYFVPSKEHEMECKTDDDFQRAMDSRRQGISNVISVAVPAAAYYNLDRLQEIQRTVLGKLGHVACVSGWDIRFDMLRQFVVNEKLEVLPQTAFGG